MFAVRKALVAGGIGAAVIAGGAAGAALMGTANAETTSTTATATDTTNTDSTTGKSAGGHVGANGTKEVVLTGDDAAKATAAALAAVPGATVDRVETDADGATYEAHVTKSDGTDATVKFDANFAVTSIETGHK